MPYDLSLEKPTVFALLFSCITLAFLFFVAGLLAGLMLGSRLPMTAQTAPASASAHEERQTAQPSLVPEAHVAPASVQAPKSLESSPNAQAAAAETAESAPPASGTGPGAVVTPNAASVASAAEAKPIIPTSPRSADAALLGVQVGAFLDNTNAEKLARTLEERGFPVDIKNRSDAKQRVWYIVRTGPYQTWEQASEDAAQLSRIDGSRALIQPFR